MKLETIEYETDGPIARITLNRPDAFNALSARMALDLFECVIAVDEDDDIRVVIITGKGGKAFCAGGDIAEFNEGIDGIYGHIKRMVAPLHTALSRLTRLDKIVIAGINGVAAGAGMGVAMAPDLAIAGESARFNMAYTGIGATPDGTTTFFLPRLVGLRRAMELTLLNRVLSAEEALDWGLVNKVVPDADLADEVEKLAQRLARGPTQALANAKKLLYRSFDQSLETQIEDETVSIANMSKTADFREGIAAFVEKRKPEFNKA